MEQKSLFNYILISVLAFLFSAAMIGLSLSGRLPFGLYDFIFVAVLLLALSLYQPRFMFWIFLSSIPLEDIVVSPPELPISLRPFQLLGAILIVATLTRWLMKKGEVKLLSLKKVCVVCQLIDRNRQHTDEPAFGFFDRIVFALGIISILVALVSPFRAVALKQALVLVSFVALYWLARNYLQTTKEKVEALWFSLVGAKVVVLYALYQAVAYRVGWPSFEVMPGRVNSTFTEPDWFGMYAVFIIALLLWVKWYYRQSANQVRVASWNLAGVVQFMANLSLLALVMVLLLTVARSAWVGAVGVFGMYFILWLFIQRSWKERVKGLVAESVVIVGVSLVALAIIQLFGLSTFHFSNRAASSVSGKQKITISCQTGSQVPSEIASTDELAQFSCRHINLEEIENERLAGQEVKEVLRPDPNVNIRKNIYSVSWEKIKERPLLGYGLGSASFFLGQDERGAGLNTSNIFLEIWLSLGIVGLVLGGLLLIGIPLLACWQLFKGNVNFQAVFVLLTATAIVLPNLFNAGLLLGFFWLWLAAVAPMANSFVKR